MVALKLFLLFFLASKEVTSEKIHEFYSIKCENHNESLFVVDKCEVTPKKSLDITFTIMKPISEIFVRNIN